MHETDHDRACWWLAPAGGSIFFTGASASLRGKANFASFAAAKAALRNLAQSIAREYGPDNIHVAHIVVDGGIEGDRLLSRVPRLKAERGPDGLLHPDAVADAYWLLHCQERSAWTLELDVRPWSEKFRAVSPGLKRATRDKLAPA